MKYLYRVIQLTNNKQKKIGLRFFDKKTAEELCNLLNKMGMTIKHYGNKIEFKIEKESKISEVFLFIRIFLARVVIKAKRTLIN